MEATPTAGPISSISGPKSPVLRRRHSLRKTVDGWEEEHSSHNTNLSSQRPQLSWDDHPYYSTRLSAGNAVVDFYDNLSQRLYFPDNSTDDTTPDDPMNVIDESFFFLDYLAKGQSSNSSASTSTSASTSASSSPSPSISGSSTTSNKAVVPVAAAATTGSNSGSSTSSRPTTNYRVSFSALLTNCHDHRMSTIAERSPMAECAPSPIELERAFAIIPSSSSSPTAKEKGKGPDHHHHLQPLDPAADAATSSDAFHPPRHPKPKPKPSETASKSKIKKRQQPQSKSVIVTFKSSSSPSFQKQRNGLRKLLDYIKPYPTRTRKTSTHNGKPRLRPTKTVHVPITYRAPETHSDRTSLADEGEEHDEDQGADEEWVLHGFFEIRALSPSSSRT